MLYARCSYCGFIQALGCSGQFMPHPPQYVAATPQGATCPVCGPLSPVFTCGACWGRQLLYVPGAPVPAPAPGMSQNYAPVIQAQPGASQSSVQEQFGEAMGAFASVLGKGVVEAMFGQRG